MQRTKTGSSIYLALHFPGSISQAALDYQADIAAGFIQRQLLAGLRQCSRQLDRQIPAIQMAPSTSSLLKTDAYLDRRLMAGG